MSVCDRARGLFSRDRGETETLKPETEAETETMPSQLETETRSRRTNFEARPSRGTTVPRDVLETEASRSRPHPWYVLSLSSTLYTLHCVREL